MNWRRVLGFQNEEEVTFAEAHNRFRVRMAGPELLPEEIFQLSGALEEARRELNPSSRVKSP